MLAMAVASLDQTMVTAALPPSLASAKGERHEQQ
jgi:hypothetical protein